MGGALDSVLPGQCPPQCSVDSRQQGLSSPGASDLTPLNHFLLCLRGIIELDSLGQSACTLAWHLLQSWRLVPADCACYQAVVLTSLPHSVPACLPLHSCVLSRYFLLSEHLTLVLLCEPRFIYLPEPCHFSSYLLFWVLHPFPAFFSGQELAALDLPGTGGSKCRLMGRLATWCLKEAVRLPHRCLPGLRVQGQPENCCRQL